ncbi:MAG: hypothetical protein ACOCTT_00905 [archaeon]
MTEEFKKGIEGTVGALGYPIYEVVKKGKDPKEAAEHMKKIFEKKKSIPERTKKHRERKDVLKKTLREVGKKTPKELRKEKKELSEKIERLEKL